MPKSKVYQILREARLANARRDVTGVPVFADELFIALTGGRKPCGIATTSQTCNGAAGFAKTTGACI